MRIEAKAGEPLHLMAETDEERAALQVYFHGDLPGLSIGVDPTELLRSCGLTETKVSPPTWAIAVEAGCCAGCCAGPPVLCSSEAVATAARDLLARVGVKVEIETVDPEPVCSTAREAFNAVVGLCFIGGCRLPKYHDGAHEGA